MSKQDTFATIMETLAENFRVVLTTPATRGYWMVMEDLTEGEMAKAAKATLGSCKFMPSAAELITFSGRGRSAAFSAAEAWGAVRAAIDKHDYTTSVDFGPTVNAIVRNLGGWLRLCDLTREDLDVWTRKEFERIYLEFADKDPGILHGEPLSGAFGGAPVRVAIGGKLPPLQISAPANPMSDLVRELAEGKSLAGAASRDSTAKFAEPASDAPAPSGTPAALPLRETKPKAPPMTAAEVAARQAEINAQVAARLALESLETRA